MDSGVDPIREQLERAYARLKTLTAGDEAERLLLEIERLERELLRRYTACVEQRDSTLPPNKTS